MTEFEDDLLAKSDHELYVEIGRALALDETGFLPSGLDALGERGQRWFSARTEDLRQAVCSSGTVRAASKNRSGDLLAAVAAAIESIVIKTAISPVCILIARIGLDRFCESEWSD